MTAGIELCGTRDIIIIIVAFAPKISLALTAQFDD